MAMTWRVKTENELLITGWAKNDGDMYSLSSYLAGGKHVPSMAKKMLEDGKFLSQADIERIKGAAQSIQIGQWFWSPEMFTPVSASAKTTAKETKTAMEKCKSIVEDFLSEHGNTLIMIAVVILLDHYLFDGALRERLKKSAEGLLDKLPGGHKPATLPGGST